MPARRAGRLRDATDLARDQAADGEAFHTQVDFLGKELRIGIADLALAGKGIWEKELLAVNLVRPNGLLALG